MTREFLKPDYIDPGGAQVAPPFRFQGVTTRVFPLRANMATLTAFCSQYLNMDIPPSIVHYRPALSYVYLMILNYGSMSAAAVQAQNLGWVAQHELTFTVPLQRWREENGKLVFKDWALVSPFIYVDDQISLNTGREVYGWPKVTGRIDSDIPAWTTDPWAGLHLFSLSTKEFAKVYAGETETDQILLRIDRDPSPTFTKFPPDPRNPWAPWFVVPNALSASMSLMGNAADMLLGSAIRGYRTGGSLSSPLAMWAKAGVNLMPLIPGLRWPFAGRSKTEAADADPDLPKLSIDQVTLKQFRDAEEPGRACYQALVSSRIGFDRLNHAGLLGDASLLRGDPSGGFNVRIRRSIAQPIIQLLGLEVAASEGAIGGDGTVAILKPVFPFAAETDLYYGKGEVICSRTHGYGDDSRDEWRDEQKDALKQKPVSRPSVPFHSFYNTALGAATEPVAGPFHFPDVTVLVYPLLADRARLDKFLDESLNDHFAIGPKPFKLVPFGSYVYLMVKVYGAQIGTMWSSSNNIGWWAEREVAFCVPVKWYDEDGKLVSVAIIEPFVYANNGRAVATDREVNGRNTIRGTIESPKDEWLTPSGPAADRQFLRLETEIFPALNLGQKAEQRTLLEIDERDVKAYNDDVGWTLVGQKWGRELADELKRKTYLRSLRQDEVRDAKALALEIFALGGPMNRLVLKQYRDAADIGQACYQALIHVTSRITRIYDVRELDRGRVHVHLHRFPDHPIAHALGLKMKSQDSAGGEVVDHFQPLRPFWMRISVEEHLGTVACWRDRKGPWTITHPWFQTPRSGSTKRRLAGTHSYFRMPGMTRVASDWADIADKKSWQRLNYWTTDYLRRSLICELTLIRENVTALGNDEKKRLCDRLPSSNRDALRDLVAAASVEEFCNAAAIDTLLSLVDAVAAADPNLQNDLKPRRLTRKEATGAISKLDEVQLVAESILSSEWENWGNPRRYRKRQGEQIEPKPDHCVPDDSCGLDKMWSKHLTRVKGEHLFVFNLKSNEEPFV